MVWEYFKAGFPRSIGIQKVNNLMMKHTISVFKTKPLFLSKMKASSFVWEVYWPNYLKI